MTRKCEKRIFPVREYEIPHRPSAGAPLLSCKPRGRRRDVVHPFVMISISDVAPRDRLHSDTRTADVYLWTVQRVFAPLLLLATGCSRQRARGVDAHLSPSTSPLSCFANCRLLKCPNATRAWAVAGGANLLPFSVTLAQSEPTGWPAHNLPLKFNSLRRLFANEWWFFCFASERSHRGNHRQLGHSVGFFSFPCEYKPLCFQTCFCPNVSLQNF